VLRVGESIVDSIVIIEPSIDEGVADTVIPAMALKDTLMNPFGVNGAIALRNAMSNVTYMGLDCNGRAIVRFDVEGFPKDVEDFWRRSHQEGLRMGVTLADALDTRKVRSGPTLPQDLPTEINPLDFVLKHVFINNMYLIHVQPADFVEDSPGLGGMDLLYKYMQPHTAYVIFVEITAAPDYYNLSSATDQLAFFKGVGSSDSAPSLAVDKGPAFRVYPGRCR
jgi:hypothetical protein